MAFRDEAEESMTSRSNQLATGYFAAIEGNDGSAGSTGATTRRKDRRPQRPHVVHEKSAARGSLVAREERQEPSAQTVGDAVGEIRQRGWSFEQKLAGPAHERLHRQSQRS